MKLSMKRNLLPLVALQLAALALVGITAPADAHHSFAMFDTKKTSVVKGMVSKVEWRNPHVYIYVHGAEGNGETKEYTIEGGSINILSRSGWKANTVKAGEEIAISFHPMLNGQPAGLLDSVTLPNGTVMKQE